MLIPLSPLATDNHPICFCNAFVQDGTPAAKLSRTSTGSIREQVSGTFGDLVVLWNVRDDHEYIYNLYSWDLIKLPIGLII